MTIFASPPITLYQSNYVVEKPLFLASDWENAARGWPGFQFYQISVATKWAERQTLYFQLSLVACKLPASERLNTCCGWRHGSGNLHLSPTFYLPPPPRRHFPTLSPRLSHYGASNNLSGHNVSEWHAWNMHSKHHSLCLRLPLVIHYLQQQYIQLLCVIGSPDDYWWWSFKRFPGHRSIYLCGTRFFFFL